MPKQTQANPLSGMEFLQRVESLAEEAGQTTDDISKGFGEKLPASLEGLGSTLSQLYFVATCAWGCSGGDHQAEWLVGRVVNHAMSSYRLSRAGFYDESLVLTRGIGEIANLFQLFETKAEFEDWQRASRRDRLSRFAPKAVRDRLKGMSSMGPAVDDNRYRMLCEVGTHPIPGFAPGHYSGTGTPVLGHLVQIGGVLVTITELSFAVAMVAIFALPHLDLPAEQKNSIFNGALGLVRSLGSIDITNYEEKMAELRTGSAKEQSIH